MGEVQRGSAFRLVLREILPAARFLCLLPILLGLLLPQGLMPGKTSDGSTGLVICTGFGPLALPSVSAPVSDEQSPAETPIEHKASPCSFAALLSADRPKQIALPLGFPQPHKISWNISQVGHPKQESQRHSQARAPPVSLIFQSHIPFDLA
ncbi:MAG: hypothetical protein HWE23_05220 [Rhodobacteraceae bacterium]|nr:hypothetical protein [Paracoccaceae bacterium]